MDEPIGDPGFFPTLLISELASKYNKVILAGEGADEIFGGYDKYKMLFYGRYVSFLIPKFDYNNDILNRIKHLNKLKEIYAYQNVFSVFEDEELKKMKIKKKIQRNFWLERGDIFRKMQYYDINTLMPEDFFMKADKMSSAYGLEERVPYMDHRIIEFGLNLPINFKLRLWNEKFILKKTFSNFLPKIIIKRRKRGYNVPIDQWFKTILKDRFFNLLEERNHSLYENKFLYRLLERVNNMKYYYKNNFYLAQKLWTVYIFEEWYKKFMDRNF